MPNIKEVIDEESRRSLEYSIESGKLNVRDPNENLIKNQAMHIGHSIKALLSEVLPSARGDYQLILDRASADFVKKLIALEIPEVFEGLVEIKKIVRI